MPDFDPNTLAQVVERMNQAMTLAFEHLLRTQQDMDQLRRAFMPAEDEAPASVEAAPQTEPQLGDLPLGVMPAGQPPHTQEHAQESFSDYEPTGGPFYQQAQPDPSLRTSERTIDDEAGVDLPVDLTLPEPTSAIPRGAAAEVNHALAGEPGQRTEPPERATPDVQPFDLPQPLPFEPPEEIASQPPLPTRGQAIAPHVPDSLPDMSDYEPFPLFGHRPPPHEMPQPWMEIRGQDEVDEITEIYEGDVHKPDDVFHTSAEFTDHDHRFRQLTVDTMDTMSQQVLQLITRLERISDRLNAQV